MIRSDKSSLLTVDQSYFVSGRQERGGFSDKFFHAAGLEAIGAARRKKARADLAASMQQVLEEVVLEICRRIATQTKVESLALSGGVALNPLLIESRLESCGLFRDIFVQPRLRVMREQRWERRSIALMGSSIYPPVTG